jgi:signal transduction histidine kinase
LSWLQTHKIQTLFVAATLLPVGALVWLGGRVLDQDRDVERQRSRERLEVSAGRLALELERRFADIETSLGRGEGIVFTSDGIQGTAALPILYQPQSSSRSTPLNPAIVAGETEEFQRQDLSAAAAAYRKAASSPEAEQRAAALLRLARVLRQSGKRADAIDAYEQLESLGSVALEGEPVVLSARQGKAKVLEESGDTEKLRREASDLALALNAGKWTINRATFDLYSEMIQRWGAPPPSAASVALTDAAIQLWRYWRQGLLTRMGRRIVHVEDVEEGSAVLALWVTTEGQSGNADTPLLWLATPDRIDAMLSPLSRDLGLTVSISDPEGQRVLGKPDVASIALTPGETRLPFILTAALTESSDGTSANTRRAIFLGGLTLTIVLMIGAAHALYRVTTRELALVRQQSEFVSTVSHEFRTPLTSMRHLTNLLVSRSITNEDRKTQYYQLLADETERLNRLVESLLSFGRIEAGSYAWQLENANVGELLCTVVDQFRQQPQAAERQILCDIIQPLRSARVDREAITRVVWNLLENAAKYSDPASPIRVIARQERETIVLSVEDKGIGIPADERKMIFKKFARGSGAGRAGIRGVGIGLALVQRIVEAHGGSVRLESEPGQGSTFTVVLPCLES